MIGATVAAGSTGTLVGRALVERARAAEGVARYPESHLLTVPFSVPPGLFIKKWILVYTNSDVAGRCIDRLTLSYQPAPARTEHVLLTFKDRSSEWQSSGCGRPRS